MRATTLIAAVAAASGGLAQNVSVGGLNISATCQQALVGLVSNQTFACLQGPALAQLVVSNTSIIPSLDQFMSGLCYTQPCSNATLDAATTAISTGCASDLAAYGVNATEVQALMGLYPLAREVLCTKTTDPYTSASYGGFLGEPPIPITGSTYNSTNGTFCVTSVLTQLSAYFGANLTVPYIVGAVTGQNQSAVDLVENIQANILCNDCLFGAFDLINVALPTLGNLTLSQLSSVVSGSMAGNSTDPTLVQIVDGECAYVPLAVTSDGTLPSNISVSIVNSTFPYPVVSANTTVPPIMPLPANMTVPPSLPVPANMTV